MGLTKMYDLIVIGGGSGGLSAAREAASIGKSVLLIERGLLGGTCVNMGCIPKKITYNLTNFLEEIELARSYGLESQLKLNFGAFMERRASSIRRLNSIYASLLEKSNVVMVRGEAAVVASGRVRVGDVTYEGGHVLLATGSRPRRLDVRGKEFLCCSDDFFYLDCVPEKTVIIGSGYISLEIAFMLSILGSDVSIVMRGKTYLSHFDEMFDRKIKEQLLKNNIKSYFEEAVLEVREEENVIREGVESGEDGDDGEKENVFREGVGDGEKENVFREGVEDGDENDISDKGENLSRKRQKSTAGSFCSKKDRKSYEVTLRGSVVKGVNFVMCAIGRDCDLSFIEPEVRSRNNYLVVDENFQTSIDGVFALGDLIGPAHMLTPFAIFCSRKLIRFLFRSEPLPKKMFDFVPSAVFTHPPCASVGYSEKDALREFGAISVYETKFNNLIYTMTDKKTESAFKAVVHKNVVVGIHLFGNNVDEIIQGFAVAIKKGLTLEDLADSVGLHPSAAEEVVTIGRVVPRNRDK